MTYVDPEGLTSLWPIAAAFGKGVLIGAATTVAAAALVTFGGVAGTALVATAAIAGGGLFLADAGVRILTGRGYTAEELATMAGAFLGGGLTGRGIGRFSESRSQSLKNPCPPPNSLTFSSPDEIFANPAILRNTSPNKVRDFFQSREGWVVEQMRQGRSQGHGLAIRELNKAGTAYTGRYIQYNGTGTNLHFRGDPYWKVSSQRSGVTHEPAFGGWLDTDLRTRY